MKHYDVIVLGTGGAGQRVAVRAAEAGKTVAVINKGPVGGVCPIRGCIPKKVLAGTAAVIDDARRLQAIGLIDRTPQIDWQQLQTFKRSFTEPVPAAATKRLQDAGIDVYLGSPRFTGDRIISINDQLLHAETVHIAVGMQPAPLPFAGAELLTDSDDFLELPSLPESLIFVGGGYISFEFAHVAALCGARVTILHADEQPLPTFDPDIIEKLLAASRELDITVVLSAAVSSIEQTKSELRLTTTDGRTFEAETAVHGAGRVPAIAELDLKKTNVTFDKQRGITVDEQLRSVSNPHVFSAGDCADAGPPLSPVAGVQGGIVQENILGAALTQPNYRSTPSVIFTSPTVGSVGLLECSAKEQGIDYEVVMNEMSDWFDAKRLNQRHAYSKVLYDKSSGKLIGAHLIGNHSEDLINIFSLAIEHGLTKQQLSDPIFAFPTASDDLRAMI